MERKYVTSLLMFCFLCVEVSLQGRLGLEVHGVRVLCWAPAPVVAKFVGPLIIVKIICYQEE